MTPLPREKTVIVKGPAVLGLTPDGWMLLGASLVVMGVSFLLGYWQAQIDRSNSTEAAREELFRVLEKQDGVVLGML